MQTPHGLSIINWLDDILYVELIGSFNREGMINYIKSIKSQIVNKQGAFSLVIDGSKFEGATIDSFEELARYNEWLNQLNQLTVKVIIQDCKIQEQIAEKFIPALNDQKIVRFTSREEALSWLKQQ